MKKIFLVITLLISVTTFAQERMKSHSHHQTSSQKYTCTMHPEVLSNKPGKCPKCGMSLVPLKKKSMKMVLNMSLCKIEIGAVVVVLDEVKSIRRKRSCWGLKGTTFANMTLCLSKML